MFYIQSIIRGTQIADTVSTFENLWNKYVLHYYHVTREDQGNEMYELYNKYTKICNIKSGWLNGWTGSK